MTPNHAPCPPVRVGVLALQGSFALHREALLTLGARVTLVRRTTDLDGLEGLVLPGGESTVMSDLGRESGLFDRLVELGRGGFPMFGTCAGAILLGQGPPDPPRLGLAPVVVERNAYGRQIDSFEKALPLFESGAPFQCVFIRAPKIRRPQDALRAGTVEVLGRDGEDPVLVRCGNLLLATFHPELTGDIRVHREFLQGVVARRRRPGEKLEPGEGEGKGKGKGRQGLPVDLRHTGLQASRS